MTKRRVDYTQYFIQIAKVANTSLPARKVLTAIAKSTTKAMRSSGCSIMLLDSKREHLVSIGAHGLSDLYLRKGTLRSHKSLPKILEGETIVITNTSKDNRVQYPEAAEREKISSILGTPLMQKGEVIGEIRVYTQEPYQFSEADKDFLRAIANVCVVLLEKDELYHMLKVDHDEAIAKRKRIAEVPKLPSSSLRPSSFAHSSEREFAKLLDFYRIEWLYEPRSFPLEWQDDKITEMFTPDFYLPELDLYIELTTLKQSLITEKNRKLRRLNELYPDIKTKLLNKSDYLKLLAKYGYGPLGETKIEGINRVLFSHTQIQRRISTLAKHISQDYSGRQLVLVGILKGVVCFMADLMRHISLPVTVDFMAISYYGGDSEQAVKITKDLDNSITGLDVLMVEDIVDTGMTLNYVLAPLAAHNPASLRVCTLLDKRARRLVNLPLDYIGFEIPDEFVVGYGLDYQGEYRNLPFIGVLKPEVTENK